MSALAIPRPVRTAGAAPAATPVRRGHLQLVGPGFVPAAPAHRSDGGAAPATELTSAARPAAIRLTPRGRLVRSLLTLTLGLSLAVGAGSWLGTLGGGEYTGPLDRVNVTAGDTLWAIATATAGTGQDVRDVVDDIVEINGLASAELAVGQQLLVPAG